MSQRNGPVKSEVVRLMAGHTGFFDGMTASMLNHHQNPSQMQTSPVTRSEASSLGLSEDSLQVPHQVLNFAEGAIIFKEKDKPKGIYVLKAGCVKLHVNRENSRGRTTTPEYVVRLVAPGEYFGYKSVMSNHTLTTTAEAVQSSTVWFYDAHSIMQLSASMHPLMKELFGQSLNEIRHFEKTGQFNYLASVQERIAFQLLELADRFGVQQSGGISINLKLTRNEFAQLASTINESLSRHLTEFKNEGLIDINGKEIIILNREGLTAKSGII